MRRGASVDVERSGFAEASLTLDSLVLIPPKESADVLHDVAIPLTDGLRDLQPGRRQEEGMATTRDALPGWRSKAEFWPTERPDHAAELARRAALGGFKIVAAAGGDGTIHEVANGALQAGRPEVCLAVLPLGSADDYAYSLAHDRDESRPVPNGPRLVDVGVVRIDGVPDHFFVCCLGFGFGPRVTMESQRIRGLPWNPGLDSQRSNLRMNRLLSP
jgi:hypothetical protein